MTSLRPTLVRVGMMDTRRPEALATLPVRHLGVLHRLWRAALKLFGVSGVLLLLGNVALLLAPFPPLQAPV